MGILQKYKSDPEVVVRETVELALGRIGEAKEGKAGEKVQHLSPYLSVDPAFPMECTDVAKLEQTLLDESLPLYQRYQAMFSLRDMNTKESIEAICKGSDFRIGLTFMHHQIFQALRRFS